MTAYNDLIDTSLPAGSDDPAEADDNMRRIQGGFQEILDVEHYSELTGTVITGSGKHKDITADTITLNTDGYIADAIAKGPVHDIRAYGAVAGGDAGDNAVAIQAAIDAAGAGAVLVPTGNFEVDAVLTADTSNLTIFGLGPGSIISATNLSGYVIKVGGAGEERINIRNLALTASGSTSGCIWLEYAHYCRFSNLYLTGSTTADAQILALIDGKSGTDLAFWNVLDTIYARFTSGTNKTCVKVTNNANATSLIGSTIRNSNASGNYGVDVDDGDMFTMLGGHIEGFDTGIRFNSHFAALFGVRIEQTGSSHTAGVLFDTGSGDTQLFGTLLNLSIRASVDNTGGANMQVGADGVALPGATSKPTLIRGRFRQTISTLDNTGTPSVSGGSVFLTGGTATITDFDSGSEGQTITVIAEHSLTITDGTNIFLSGSVNWAMTATDTLTLIQKADGKWYETSRSDSGA